MKNLEAIIRERQEYKRIAEEAKAKADELDALIKQAMTGSKMVVGPYKLSLTMVSKTSLDTKTLKADLPLVYEKYAKVSESARFIIN